MVLGDRRREREEVDLLRSAYFKFVSPRLVWQNFEQGSI